VHFQSFNRSGVSENPTNPDWHNDLLHVLGGEKVLHRLNVEALEEQLRTTSIILHTVEKNIFCPFSTV
jgi:hypothetical protein